MSQKLMAQAEPEVSLSPRDYRPDCGFEGTQIRELLLFIHVGGAAQDDQARKCVQLRQGFVPGFQNPVTRLGLRQGRQQVGARPLPSHVLDDQKILFLHFPYPSRQTN
jgi:hypothetical protein